MQHAPKAIALALLIANCTPTPEDPRTGASSPAPVPSVEFSPPLENDIAQTVLQIAVATEKPTGSPILLKGELSAKEIKDYKPSQSLLERTITCSQYVDHSNRLVLAPQRPLETRQPYTLLFSDLSYAIHFTTTDIQSEFGRIWPPIDVPSLSPLAAYCPSMDGIRGTTQSAPHSVLLAPSWIKATADYGVLPGIGTGCIHLLFRPSEAAPLILPPLLAESEAGNLALLSPEPINLASTIASIAPTACPSDAIESAEACFFASDDRVKIRSRIGPMLIGVEFGDERIAAKVDDDHILTIRNLAPNTGLEMSLQEIGIDGRWLRESISIFTKKQDSHIIINEIMSNPTGKEPDQEWIELYNDSPLICNLRGFRISDSQLESELPEVPIPGESFALLVNQSFRLDAMETAPPAATTIIRLKSLSKNGISNSGETISLIHPEGKVASSVPAIASPKQGFSLERIRLEAPDERAASFRQSTHGGSPGLPTNHSN